MEFRWIVYLFGAFLLFTGYQMLRTADPFMVCTSNVFAILGLRAL